MKGIVLFSGLAAALLSIASCGESVPPYKNPKLSPEERTEDLLSRMTVEEKFWQCYMMPGDLDKGSGPYKHGIFGFQVATLGAVDPEMKQLLQYNPGLNAKEMAKKINDIQRYFVDSTRLGIPIIAFDETLHGLVREGATSFPQAIGLAASFDTTLMSRVSHAIAMETKTRGIRHILSPVVNLATDIRWGRTEETYGEDPYLSACMGVNFVKNFEKMGVATTPKHYTANSGDGGRDSNPIHFTERYLEETHLMPFKACFLEGGSQSVMTSYNMIDGTPCTASEWLLIEKLRNEWGFDGFTISDADAVGIIHKLHHTVNSWAEAGADALNGGLDVIFQVDYNEHKPFLEACLDGLVSEEALDRACGAVLKAKFRMGLFENPYIDEEEADKWNGCTTHRELTREAAVKSMVLLKNDDALLPLSGKTGSIALIGQDAAEARLGGYSGPGINKVSILEALKERCGSKVRYEHGCDRVPETYVTVPSSCLSTASGEPGLDGAYFDNISWSGEPAVKRIDEKIQFSWTLFAPDPALPVDWFSVEWTGKLTSPVSGKYNIGIEGNDGYQLIINDRVIIDSPVKKSFGTSMVPFNFVQGRKYDIKIRFYENTRNAKVRLVWNVGVKSEDASISRAVRLAAKSDVAVVVAGIHEGEFQDRGYCGLPGRQAELIRKVAATGTPTVVVLVGGSPVIAKDWIGDVESVLEAWYPGEDGGNAVADVLFGDYNPSGRLPVTWPIDEAQLPLNYSHKPTGRSDDYYNLTGEPMFPFGYGLSYTSFEYSDLKVTECPGPEAKDCGITVRPEKGTGTSGRGKAFEVSFKVRNTGRYDGTEIVQFYVRDMVASLTQPISRLVHFEPVELKSGEETTVTYVVDEFDLSMLDKDLERVVEPGDFRLMVGSSSKDIRFKTTLTVR